MEKYENDPEVTWLMIKIKDTMGSTSSLPVSMPGEITGASLRER